MTAAEASAPATLDASLIVTQVPTSNAAGATRATGFASARLVVVAPDGRQRVLSEGFASACDPDVSFDGQKLLFAGQQQRGGSWRIWEIGLDGQGLRAISPEGIDARHPIYVSVLNTLESPQPWPTVVFVGRETTVNETGRAEAATLYDVKLDGTELRRLTFNPNHNLDPVQLWDGRVIYSAERHPQEPGTGEAHAGLYAIHIEGADMELYGGERGARFQRMPCATPGGLVVFVESGEPVTDGGGQLACVEQRRPHVTHRTLTTDAAFRYANPAPLQGNQVLVSRRSLKGRDTAAIVRFDADRGTSEVVFDTAEFDEVQAVPVQPRARPDGHSTVVVTKGDFGTLYGLNSYTTDAARTGQLRPGEVKRVRFIEGQVPAAAPGAGAPGPVIGRRLIGEAPVEADGSFNVVVPADTPLLLQTLDERGLALGTCGWIWVKPKEVRGCIGCHEDPELVPENDFVQALHRPSNPLLVPVEQRRTVTFRDHVAPILQQSCATAECHGSRKNRLHLPLTATQPDAAALRKAYDALTAPAKKPGKDTPAWPVAGRYVDAGRARTSRLVWQVVGADTSRPWDRAAAGDAKPFKPVAAHRKARPLTPEELATLIEWIDLGAQFEAVNAPVSEKGNAAK